MKCGDCKIDCTENEVLGNKFYFCPSCRKEVVDSTPIYPPINKEDMEEFARYVDAHRGLVDEDGDDPFGAPASDDAYDDFYAFYYGTNPSTGDETNE